MTDKASSTPTLKALTGIFLRIGNATFGGGYVTMAALGRELADLRHWITNDDFGLAYALARVTPGTNVIAFCAAIGWIILGLSGAVAAVMALTVPSAAFAVVLLQALESGSTHPLLMSAIGGTVAAVSGTMASTVWTLIRPFVRGGANDVARTVVLFGGSFVASWKFGFTPVPVLAVASVIALLWKDAPGAKSANREAARKNAG